MPAFEAPDEVSDVAEHRRQNSQTGRKGSYKREMTDAAMGPLLGNPAMVDALLSRLRHYCHTVRINGPSLRDPQG